MEKRSAGLGQGHIYCNVRTHLGWRSGLYFGKEVRKVIKLSEWRPSQQAALAIPPVLWPWGSCSSLRVQPRARLLRGTSLRLCTSCRVFRFSCIIWMGWGKSFLLLTLQSSVAEINPFHDSKCGRQPERPSPVELVSMNLLSSAFSFNTTRGSLSRSSEREVHLGSSWLLFSFHESSGLSPPPQGIHWWITLTQYFVICIF